MSTANRAMTAREWILLLTLSILWGGSFFFVGVAVRDLPTFTIVFARVALAALILLAVLRSTGATLPRDGTVWLAFLGMGVMNNVVPFSLIVWGQGHLPSGAASILNATTPLFTLLVAHAFTADEKLTPARVAGVLFGLVGVTVLIGVEALTTLGTALFAALACLLAALSYGFAGVFGRRFRRLGVPPMATAAGQLAASSLVLVPIWLLVDAPWTLATPSLATLAALIGLAALSTALAYVLYFEILATAGATNLLLVTLLIPVTAILLGVGILGEAFLWRYGFGMALIGCGLLAIDGRVAALVRRPERHSAPPS